MAAIKASSTHRTAPRASPVRGRAATPQRDRRDEGSRRDRWLGADRPRARTSERPGPAWDEASTVLLNVQPNPEDGRLRGYGSFKNQAIHDRLINDLGRPVVSSAGRRLDQAGILHKERIELGDATKTILRVAQEERCDLILLGQARPGAVRRWLAKATGVALGSIGSQVVQLADMPVVVVK